MSRIYEQNRRAWNREVEAGNEWTQPVDSEVIERARRGDWSVLLTPTKAVPREWFGDLRGKAVLGLASGGGQQCPIFAAAGADVTSFDASDAQLANDRLVAERDGLPLRTVQGDMADLSVFAVPRFDRGELAITKRLPVVEEHDGMVECSHTLDALLGGQMRAGLAVTGFYEDEWDAWEALYGVAPSTFATRAIKLR